MILEAYWIINKPILKINDKQRKTFGEGKNILLMLKMTVLNVSKPTEYFLLRLSEPSHSPCSTSGKWKDLLSLRFIASNVRFKKVG